MGKTPANNLDAHRPASKTSIASELKTSGSPVKNHRTDNNLVIGEVLLTEHDLARRQNRSVKTIRNQRVLGNGIPFIKIGHLVRYRLNDVVAMENGHRRLSTSEKA